MEQLKVALTEQMLAEKLVLKLPVTSVAYLAFQSVDLKVFDKVDWMVLKKVA